jgi:hypothetical protein
MRIGSVLKHTSQAVLEGALIAALIVGLVAGTALAARGGGHGGGGTTTSGGGTIALAPLVVDLNDNGTPNYGDVVTFTISTDATTSPYVNLVCSQNGSVVLNGWKGYWVGSLDTNWNFGLSSGAWQGGAVDCTAYLTKQTKQGWSRLASTSFRADG